MYNGDINMGGFLCGLITGIIIGELITIFIFALLNVNRR